MFQPVARCFADARRNSQTVLMPFLTAGDPDLPTTLALLQRIDAEAVRLGVPLLFEIGFPYSDPIADGPVIQESFNRALAAGVRVVDILGMIDQASQSIRAPLVAMVSASIVLRHGLEKFFQAVKAHGGGGVIIPDLPLEEGAGARRLADACGLCFIPLVAPTTPEDRLQAILDSASGFIYCVGTLGITGARARLAVDLHQRIAHLKSRTSLPIAVGFGVSRPEHVSALAGQADGVIVGSAIVGQLAGITPCGGASLDQLTAGVVELLRSLAKLS